MECFCIIDFIEDITKFFDEYMDIVAIFELLIIITLIIFYFSTKQNLEEKCDRLQRELSLYYSQSLLTRAPKLRQSPSSQEKTTRIQDSGKTGATESTFQPGRNGLVSNGDNGCAINDEENETTNATDTGLTKRYETIHEYMYLEPASNGKFFKSKVSEERASFRTWYEGGVKKFEFCGNITNALANLNATFDDSCIIEGKQNGTTEIINVEPGTLSEELAIITKAKIRLQ